MTVVNAPKASALTSERTHDVQNIEELRLPGELVDEPFYLVHFVAGYSYYDQANYKEAKSNFEAALSHRGGSPNENADLQSLIIEILRERRRFDRLAAFVF